MVAQPPLHALDDRDLAILSILSREGRITKTALAARVNLSPTPCWTRLRRLERAGLITAYRAEVALERIAPHLTAFVTVEIETHSAEGFERFEAGIADRAEIVGCWALGGGVDYLLQVVARDIDHYQAVIDALLGGGTGVRRYYTYVVTKRVKTAGAPPFAALLSPEDFSAQGVAVR